MVLAAGFISVFTDNPVGGENLAPDIPSAVWIRLQPITSPYTLCQSKKVFSETYERTIINRTVEKKKKGPSLVRCQGKNPVRIKPLLAPGTLSFYGLGGFY